MRRLIIIAVAVMLAVPALTVLVIFSISEYYLQRKHTVSVEPVTIAAFPSRSPISLLSPSGS